MDPRWTYLINHPDYDCPFRGIMLTVRNGVFTHDPAVSLSTTLIADTLPSVAGRTVVDIGCGTGALGIWCAKQGATHVTCVDIDPLAVANTRENVRRTQLGDVVTTSVGDLFDGAPGKFDVVLANLPINEEVWDAARTPKKTMERFTQELAKHLNPGGVALITWASFGEAGVVEAACAHARLQWTRTERAQDDLIWSVYHVTCAPR